MDADKRAALGRYRVTMGFVVGPLAGGLAASAALLGFGHNWAAAPSFGLFSAVLYGYPAALLLGLPAYLGLRRRLRMSALNCAIAGAVIAAIPMGALTFYVDAAVPSARGGEWLWFGTLVGAGFIGGLAFWLTAGLGANPPPPPPLRGPPPP